MADWSSLPSDLARRIAGCLLATNDPANFSDPRFRPRNWIIIDKAFEIDSCLMVKTANGRVLRKDLPVLRFTADVPYNMKVFPAALSCHSSTSLRLIWDSDRGQPDGYCDMYTADPDIEGFTVYEEEDCGYLLQRLAALGFISKDRDLLEPLTPLPVAVAEKIFDAVRLS